MIRVVVVVVVVIIIIIIIMSSKLESDACCRLQVAPSGESYGGNRRPGRK